MFGLAAVKYREMCEWVTASNAVLSLFVLACMPAYGRHKLGCQPSAGTGAYPQNFVTDKQALRLLYIDEYGLQYL